MEIFSGILNCIGFIILAIGTVCVYDARKLTQRYFSKKNTNETTTMVKKIGFGLFVIGGTIVIATVCSTVN